MIFNLLVSAYFVKENSKIKILSPRNYSKKDFSFPK